MNRTIFKSKIHRATVTHADLHYVGSVTVDLDLLEAADILPGELVAIVDVTNGARLETYTIAGERGSGVIGINGAAAHLMHENDIVVPEPNRYAGPLTVDEARREMDDLNHRFVYFIDAADNRGKVIYLRHDGDYGLVEPE